MQIRVKKLHPKAKLPTRGTSGAGGLDLYAVKDMMLLEDTPTKVPTGIAIEIPTGHAGFIMTRSSTALKGVHISQTLIDSDYRGELFITATKYCGDSDHFIPLPELELEWSDELSETDRGEGGYGSTGR